MKKGLKVFIVILVLGFTLLLAACGGDGDGYSNLPKEESVQLVE